MRASGKRPTPTQASILRRMAQGHPIKVSTFGRLSIVSEDGRVTDTVLPVTSSALRRRGWVASIFLPNGRPELVLTDAGLIAAGPPPAGSEV